MNEAYRVKNSEDVRREVMIDGTITEAGVEETRICAAYRRRTKDKVLYSWFNAGHLFFIQERERRVVQLLKRQGFSELEQKRICEIGCGTGYWLREFIKWGSPPRNLVGIDLLPERVAEAKTLCPSEVRIETGSAAELKFPDRTFDLVLQSTVLTSILDASLKRKIASEMLRVVKDEGFILWYDYMVNNPWNPDVKGIGKKEITQLFPGCRIEMQRITLVPPFCRWLAPYSWMACHLLERMRVFNTHYLGVISKA
jgi:ubiquinone/menaquinone biosynthesis C-methylase UbiE